MYLCENISLPIRCMRSMKKPLNIQHLKPLLILQRFKGQSHTLFLVLLFKKEYLVGQLRGQSFNLSRKNRNLDLLN